MHWLAFRVRTVPSFTSRTVPLESLHPAARRLRRAIPISLSPDHGPHRRALFTLTHATTPYRIYELQAFLTELVSNFQFELSDDVARIRKTTAIVMVPTLDGEVDKGAQLPLRVSLAPRAE